MPTAAASPHTRPAFNTLELHQQLGTAIWSDGGRKGFCSLAARTYNLNQQLQAARPPRVRVYPDTDDSCRMRHAGAYGAWAVCVLLRLPYGGPMLRVRCQSDARRASLLSRQKDATRSPVNRPPLACSAGLPSCLSHRLALICGTTNRMLMQVSKGPTTPGMAPTVSVCHSSDQICPPLPLLPPASFLVVCGDFRHKSG